jgi:hypothetical protein
VPWQFCNASHRQLKYSGNELTQGPNQTCPRQRCAVSELGPDTSPQPQRPENMITWRMSLSSSPAKLSFEELFSYTLRQFRWNLEDLAFFKKKNKREMNRSNHLSVKAKLVYKLSVVLTGAIGICFFGIVLGSYRSTRAPKSEQTAGKQSIYPCTPRR